MLFLPQYGWNLVLLSAAALLLALYIRHINRIKIQSRAQRLHSTYSVLSRERLDNIPDSELVDAVVANLLAKLDWKKPDDYAVIPMLSLERLTVYSVWLTLKEIDSIGLEAYLDSRSARFAEFAIDGFICIGAQKCALALSDSLKVYKEIKSEILDAKTAFVESVSLENPLCLLRDFIRNNPDGFVD